MRRNYSGETRNYSGLSAERELIRDASRESLPREKDLRTRERERMQRYQGDRRRYEAEEPEWYSSRFSIFSNETKLTHVYIMMQPYPYVQSLSERSIILTDVSIVSHVYCRSNCWQEHIYHLPYGLT